MAYRQQMDTDENMKCVTNGKCIYFKTARVASTAMNVEGNDRGMY